MTLCWISVHLLFLLLIYAPFGLQSPVSGWCASVYMCWTHGLLDFHSETHTCNTIIDLQHLRFVKCYRVTPQENFYIRNVFRQWPPWFKLSHCTHLFLMTTNNGDIAVILTYFITTMFCWLKQTQFCIPALVLIIGDHFFMRCIVSEKLDYMLHLIVRFPSP